MQLDYTKIPEKTKLLHALKYQKIAGLKAKPINLEDPNLFETMQKLGWKMVKTCIEDNGIGLAAPQLGIPKRVFIAIGFDDSYVWKFNGTFNLYINPIVIPVKNSEKIGEHEGCLSVGKTLLIIRPREVDVDYWYFDSNGKLKNSRERLRGHLSRIFQHEFQHLEGGNIVELYERQGNTRKKREKSMKDRDETEITEAKPSQNTKEEKPKKRGRGRPKGSKDKKKRSRRKKMK